MQKRKTKQIRKVLKEEGSAKKDEREKDLYKAGGFMLQVFKIDPSCKF